MYLKDEILIALEEIQAKNIKKNQTLNDDDILTLFLSSLIEEEA